MTRIAIIGAGATGLAAARRLTARGLSVDLFDKGRRAGGRMASREGEHGSFDHGVQFVRFSARADADSVPGLLLPWGAVGGWVAAPTMNAWAGHWARGLNLQCGQAVTAIRRDPAGWHLTLADQRPAGPYAHLLLTVPTPQAIALLATAGIAPGPLAAVRYQPNWTLMWTPAVALPENVVAEAGALGDPIAWLAREDRKPGRDGPPRLTVQASAAWSTEHLALNAEAAAARLVALAADRLGVTAISRHAVAHRWLYAFVEQPIGQPCLPLGPALHYAGDACLGSRVGLAIESGEAAAAAIIASG